MANILFPNQQDYLEKISTYSDPLLTEMENFAKVKRIPILERNAVLFLEQLVIMSKPKHFLEIGTAIGYSTIRVAKIIQNEGVIETIEKSNDNIKLANSFIKKANLEDKIKIHEGDAAELMMKMDSVYDFIFLDADKEDYLQLFNLAMKILINGGLILVDNLLWKGYAASENVPEEYKKSTELIRKFNANFLNFPKLKATILPIGDGLGLGIKKS